MRLVSAIGLISLIADCSKASWMEPQWKKSYFGVNYDKLLKIKQKYDPNNTLWCHPCVGADVFSQKSDGKLYI
jgi:hypothetical protein